MRIKHTEKISLAISILLFVVLFYLFSSLDYKHKSDKTSYQRFTSKIKSGVTYFIFEKELSVMPGDFLHLYSPDNELVEKYEVESIAVPSRQEITLHTTGQSFTGTTRQELSIEKGWEKSTGVVSLRDGRETLQVKISDIDKINGKLWLRINANLDTLNSQKTKLSFYQKIQSNEGIKSSFERVKWTSTSGEANQTLYDMFTPPIIYIHDGELTTKLPEKKAIVEEIEPFGLELIEVTKAEYPFRLKSWVGQTPYFEDTGTIEEGNGKTIRNRIEVGKPYKRIINRKPGQPSLEVCDENDPDKMFMVQFFTVQQYRNPETGGLKPVGRAMIKDYRMDGDPFEINSLMKKVYAGSLKIRFKASLPNLPSEEFTYDSSSDIGVFDYGGRKFIVSNIELKNKTLKVTKQDPRIAEDSFQNFSF